MKKLIKPINIIIGSFITALGLNVFLIPNKISAGGVSGIGTILFFVYKIPVWVTVFVLNSLLFIFGFKNLSRSQLVYSAMSAGLLSLFLNLTQNIIFFSNDMILCAVYGGAVSGFGIGLVIANGAATGGTDLFAVMVNKKFQHISVGRIILMCDIIIIGVAAIAFSDFSIVLYCVLALFVNVKITDYIVDGMDYSKSMYIISDKHEQIAKQILTNINRGVTGIHSKGMYSENERIMLMCVVRPRQVARVKNIVKEIDDKAFIILSDVSQTVGEGFSNKF